MLEISLSAVAAFAAYTLYAIVGDELRANKKTHQNTSKQRPIAASKTEVSPSPIKPAKPASKPKATTARKPRTSKTEKPVDQVDTTSAAILAYVSKNGSVTITNLTKELKMDKATVTLAAEKLIADKSVLSIKRGGYPAIAPVTN